MATNATFFCCIALIVICKSVTRPFEHRSPFHLQQGKDIIVNVEADCQHPGLCAGCGTYPSSSSINYYAEFDVPPIPTVIGGTYYIYFNIFFGNAEGGKFNQFVPQLMLGSALSGSSNYPYYKPIFNNLKTWHFGSQYFFALNNASVSSGWSAYAKTGELIDCYAGQTLYTQFSLNDDKNEWTLTMGIKGNETAVSVVTTNVPYMGLLNTTKSWIEDTYNHTFVGSCWELYGISQRGNYPNYMNYTHNISTKSAANWYRQWKMDEIPDCSYSPNYTLNSNVNTQQTDQIALFDIYYPN